MGLSHAFGPESAWPTQDLVALSEGFDAELTAEAYRAGVFPMPLHDADWPPGAMAWWSPVSRGVLPLDDLRITRSLAKSLRRYRVSIDAAFSDVLAACGDPRRPDGWIDDDIVDVYSDLFACGLAHSVEVWTPDGALVGGLYGVAIGGLFAGESMFHDPERGRDASKVALVRLVQALSDGRERLLDVQWLTPHLESLGAIEVPRTTYLDLLDAALDVPGLDWAAAGAAVSAVPENAPRVPA